MGEKEDPNIRAAIYQSMRALYLICFYLKDVIQFTGRRSSSLLPSKDELAAATDSHHQEHKINIWFDFVTNLHFTVRRTSRISTLSNFHVIHLSQFYHSNIN